MNTYKITLSTVADITVTVEADDEDDALDVAYATARDFANQDHAGNHYTVDINSEWQYGEPAVRREPTTA